MHFGGARRWVPQPTLVVCSVACISQFQALSC